MKLLGGWGIVFGVGLFFGLNLQVAQVIIFNHKNLTEKRISYEQYCTKTIFKPI
jgi:hypothetical protein